MVASDTMNIAKRFTSIFAVVAVSALLGAAVPAASAGGAMADTTVTATRSFPKTTAAKRDFLAEHTSTDVESNADWGGIESLDVPQTESQAEKDQKAQEQAEAEAQAQAAQTQAQAESQAASRSSDRASISVPTAPASATGQALADYALQFQGYPYVAGGNTPSGWDCSGFVQWVFAQFGVSLPHYSGAQMSVGTAVGSIAEAAPGDIIVNTQHAAIYIGNGMVINALNPAQGTQVTSLAVFSGGYAIRRVL
ncbi:C40 family peptidase [Bifidobacterium pseudocatenulatum]|uniref:C40 family peptidase n=1 Tax=Bifidobacterium pseudocatenulatum TaxID=28026 RepID=UPI000E447008|nr:C40 family peptidase [Bifidobacterium pseudocatenulatum]MDB6517085.1 C40 family peptidase [Bifidobacterium pseudocatenulatum]MDB6517633.1 C40 family peptidase [Bifidobacterium pseudocatenulatum]MDB6520259.1 C40 family peptidase [Bifidobacterium pseudocatenulatum]MDB6521122.1 C40 family peptidase [Bifidobacterium pseudocatenulatum]MDB6523224.1 C40 family peptidase [Bifidobacterium pseudocatenulatum]